MIENIKAGRRVTGGGVLKRGQKKEKKVAVCGREGLRIDISLKLVSTWLLKKLDMKTGGWETGMGCPVA